MELNEFIQFFAEQFDETPADVFAADTRFRDLEEWNSMVALSIIAMTDEKYKVRLTGDDIRASNTVNDVFEKVTAKKQAQ